jgi:hypothetical protein
MFRLRLLFPAVTLIVGIIMLSIPWIMPFAHPHERAVVFVVAGVVELVLGGTLTYVILHQPLDDADLPERAGRSKSSRAERHA